VKKVQKISREKFSSALDNLIDPRRCMDPRGSGSQIGHGGGKSRLVFYRF